MPMIAAVQARQNSLCIVRSTARHGIRVLTTTYCGVEVAAGDGVDQVHSNAITCEHCKREVKIAFGVDYNR